MAIRISAKETLINVGTLKGQYRFVMQAERYNTLSEQKVLREASVRSGIPQGTLVAGWDAIGEVIKAWATEGHSVAIPGLGTMRFGVRATSVGSVDEVSDSLITSRRVIFTPSVEIKDELKDTSVSIICYDKEGNILKQTTSGDGGNVEDPDDNPTGGGSNPGGDGGNQGGQGGNTGGGSDTGDGSDDNQGENPLG